MPVKLHFSDAQSEYSISKKLISSYAFMTAVQIIPYNGIIVNSIKLKMEYIFYNEEGVKDTIIRAIENPVVSLYSSTGTELHPITIAHPINSIFTLSNLKSASIKSETPGGDFQITFNLYKKQPIFIR